MAPAGAEEELGRACGGRVVAERHRIRAERRDLLGRVELPPCGERPFRRADFGFPGPELKRRRHAEPRDAQPLDLRKRRGQRGDPFADELEDRGRRRERKGFVRALADAAAEVDEHEVAAAPADGQTERMRPFRIERHGHGRLADAAPQGGLALEEPFRLEPVHDRRGRLHRQSRQSRHFDFRQRPETPHQSENQPLVVEANAGLVGAAGGAGVQRLRLCACRLGREAPTRLRCVPRLRHPPPLSRFLLNFRKLSPGPARMSRIIKPDIIILTPARLFASLGRRRKGRRGARSVSAAREQASPAPWED